MDFVNSLDKEKFNKRLWENIPQGIVSREPDSFADYRGVDASELQSAI